EAAIDHADQANWGPDLVERLSDPEFASRLAKFLWNGSPDGTLLEIASAGRLRTSLELRQQINRMIRDSRSSALLATFFSPWLQLDRLATMTADWPNLDRDLREAFRREIDLFLTSQLREDHGAVDLLTANYTFVNDRLASHYASRTLLATSSS